MCIGTIQGRVRTEYDLHSFYIFLDHRIHDTGRQTAATGHHAVAAICHLKDLGIEGIVETAGIDAYAGYANAHKFNPLDLQRFSF
jgi:hypothetical protein